jgi:hypothetical protein
MLKSLLLSAILFLFVKTAQAQLYSNAAANLPANATKQSMDVQAADLDGDGDLDIVKANEFQTNNILRNNGQGVFTAAPAGSLPAVSKDSEDVAVADFNGDGHPDLVFCSEDNINLGQVNVHEYYLGDGSGNFSVAPFQLPDNESNAVIAADINSDSKPDLFFGNKGATTVLINNSDGTFVNESNRVPAIQRTTQDLALADVDGDGDLDLFAGNEDGNLLFINDGTGHFADESATRLPQGINMETRKVTFGDADGDNDADVLLSNVAFLPGKNPQNRLYLNDGTGYFSDATATNLPADTYHTIDAIFEDVDLDGDLDLVVGNVFGGPLQVYQNDGNGVFSDATTEVLGLNYHLDALGLIAADLNGDGLRDLYVCHRQTPQSIAKDLLLLRNAPVSAKEKSSKEPTVLLYPNPASQYFFLLADVSHIDSVRLLELDGRKVADLQTYQVADGIFKCALPNVSLRKGGAYAVEIQMKKTILRRVLFVG